MFIIEEKNPTDGRWFRVWSSQNVKDDPNGADCATYLRSLTQNESRPGVEYRMRYLKVIPQPA
jgi:hypothetical protein